MTEPRQNKGYLHGAAILAAGVMIVRIIGAIFRIPLANILGTDGMSTWTVAFSVYQFFIILSSAGMPAAISKLVAERASLGRHDEAHRVFHVALAIAVSFGAVCMCVLFFGAERLTGAINAPRSYYSLMTLSPTVFIVAIIAIFRGYFQGLGTTVPTAVSQVVEQIFNAVFSVVLAGAFMGLAAAHTDPAAFGAAGGTAGTGVGAVFGLFTIIIYYLLNRRSIRKKTRFSAIKNVTAKKESTRKLAWLIIRTAMPIIAGTAVLSFTNLIDATMVTARLVSGGFSVSEADIMFGYLSKYSHVITLPISIAAVFSLASIPSISSSNAKKDAPAVESKINSALRMTMLICVPAAAGLLVLGSSIIAMLFRQFPEGGFLLQIGAANVVFMALNQILTGPLQATGYLKIPVLAALAGSFVKIAANQFLIPLPFINIRGAVIGTSLCYITAASINWYWLKKKAGIRIQFKKLMLKPVLSSVIMGVLCFAIYRGSTLIGLGNTVSTLCAIAAGFAAYLFFMVKFRGLEKDDIRLLPYGKKITSALERRNLL